jgi:hypothetical protein
MPNASQGPGPIAYWVSSIEIERVRVKQGT